MVDAPVPSCIQLHSTCCLSTCHKLHQLLFEVGSSRRHAHHTRGGNVLLYSLLRLRLFPAQSRFWGHRCSMLLETFFSSSVLCLYLDISLSHPGEENDSHPQQTVCKTFIFYINWPGGLTKRFHLFRPICRGSFLPQRLKKKKNPSLYIIRVFPVLTKTAEHLLLLSFCTLTITTLPSGCGFILKR